MRYLVYYLFPALLLFSACGEESTDEPSVPAISDTISTVDFRASGFGDYHDGDLLFIVDSYQPAAAMAKASGETWNQVGMIFNRPDGTTNVFEAYGKVRITPLNEFLERSQDGKLRVMRLNNDLGKTKEELIETTKPLFKEFRSRPYDRGLSWSDEEFYASELIWKMYDRGLGIKLCEPGKLADFDFSDGIWQETLTQVYGFDWPLDSPAVSVEALMNSDQLFEVHEN